MSEPLFWLVKGEERHAVHVRDDGLAVPSRVRLWVWSPRHERVVFPGGAEARPAVMPTTTDEAAALIRALALPVGGYEVRERGMAGAWTGRPRRCYDVEDGRWIASEVADDGWRCWLDYGGGEESDDGVAHGPETGDAGKAAADAWLTAHAPWVTLEGGAFVLPPAEPVDPLAVFDDVVEAERAAAQRIAADRGRAGVEAMAQVVGVQALTVRLEALDARVVALEAGRASPVGLPLSVEPIPYGDGDGFAVLVTLPSGRCLSVDRDSDRCLTVERDMHRKYRTQREVDAAVRYWRGVFGLGVST